MSYNFLSTVTLGANSNVIEFTDLPQDGYGLALRFSLKVTATAQSQNFLVRFNNDSTSGNYTGRFIYGNLSTTIPGTTTNSINIYSSAGANSASKNFNNAELRILQYTSGGNKLWNGESSYQGTGNQAGEGIYSIYGGRYTGPAVTSIQVLSLSSFVANSTVSLYKII